MGTPLKVRGDALATHSPGVVPGGVSFPCARMSLLTPSTSSNGTRLLVASARQSWKASKWRTGSARSPDAQHRRMSTLRLADKL